jgi:hypothetical protein
MFLLRHIGMPGGYAKRPLICAIFMLLPIAAWGQGAVDLSGKWTLDTVLSDSPEQTAAAIRIDLGLGGFENLFAESGGRGGGRGNGGRHGSESRPGAAQNHQPNAEEQKRIDELTQSLRYPPTTLTIAQTPTALTITDEQQR